MFIRTWESHPVLVQVKGVNKPRNDTMMLELIEQRQNSCLALQERSQTRASELENTRFFVLMRS